MTMTNWEYQQTRRLYSIAQYAIQLAERHKHEGVMAGSARVALDDAKKLLDKGEFRFARCRAIESLEYSVGIFHADYRQIAINEAETLIKDAADQTDRLNAAIAEYKKETL